MEIDLDKPIKPIKLQEWNDKDFNLWRRQASSTFRLHSLMGIVDGSVPIPERPVPQSGDDGPVLDDDPAFLNSLARWRRGNMLACESLVNCVKGHELRRISTMENANEMWEALNLAYGEANSLRASTARKLISTLVYNPTTSTMQAHVDKFESYRFVLDANSPVLLSDEAVNIDFISSLGPAWTQFHQANRMNLKVWKPEQLYAEVIAFEEGNLQNTKLQAAPVESPKNNPQANVSLGRNGKRKGYGGYNNNKNKDGKKKKDGYCFYHDSDKHDISDCRYIQKLKKDRPPGAYNGERGNSGRGNHDGNKDRQRFDHFRQPRNNQSGSAPYAIVSLFVSPSMPSAVTLQSVSSTIDVNEWGIDSLANRCITPFKDRLRNFIPFPSPGSVSALGGSEEAALGMGDLTLTDLNGHRYTIKDVLHVPTAKHQLLSLCQLMDAKLDIQFIDGSKNFTLKAQNSPFILYGFSRNNLLYIREQAAPPQASAAITRQSAKRAREIISNITRPRKRRRVNLTPSPIVPSPSSSPPPLDLISEINNDISNESNEIQRRSPNPDEFNYPPPESTRSSPISIHRSPTPSPPPFSIQNPINPPIQLDPQVAPSYWHLVLGHASRHTLKNMKILQDADFSVDCIACMKAKTHRQPHYTATEFRSTRPLEMVHSDLCGYFPPSEKDQDIQYISFIDDYTRFTWIYTIPDKTTVTIARIFTRWLNIVQNNEHGWRVKYLRTDDGSEYTGALIPVLEANGIQRPPAPRYTPEYNGVAERANRTIQETLRALLFQANMPYRFWADAARTAVFVRNMLPHSSLHNKASPYELWYGKSPDYFMLKPFGCLVWTHIPEDVRKR